MCIKSALKIILSINRHRAYAIMDVVLNNTIILLLWDAKLVQYIVVTAKISTNAKAVSHLKIGSCINIPAFLKMATTKVIPLSLLPAPVHACIALYLQRTAPNAQQASIRLFLISNVNCVVFTFQTAWNAWKINVWGVWLIIFF